jgi:hypothetical protein
MLYSPTVFTDCTPATRMPYHDEVRVMTQAIDWPTVLPGDLTGDTLAASWVKLSDRSGAAVGFGEKARSVHGDVRRADDASLRLHLLARKYGSSTFAREDDARLEILNERLSHVMRRVTEGDVVALESAAQQLESSRDLRRELQLKYGIQAGPSISLPAEPTK